MLELSVGTEGSSLRRLTDAWPSYLAYFVSFATIGAAWLAHAGITDRLTKADLGLLRINLLVLLVIGFLPFPTKLVAESLHVGHGDRVYVTLCGLTLLALRVLLDAVDEYARRAGLFDERGAVSDLVQTNPTVVLAAYGIALGIGLLLPWLALSPVLRARRGPDLALLRPRAPDGPPEALTAPAYQVLRGSLTYPSTIMDDLTLTLVRHRDHLREVGDVLARFGLAAWVSRATGPGGPPWISKRSRMPKRRLPTFKRLSTTPSRSQGGAPR